MPSMFSSRRRGTSTPPVDPNTLKSATVAASSAFLQRPSSSASLSSAAAAAALRSQTASPEPVGSIQTKRMQRRGSTSSVGSGSVAGRGARDGGARGLQRTNSGGSMTERTFRSPSPGFRQTNGVKGPASPTAEVVPPVPAIPPGVARHKRASSMEPAPRIMSPTPPAGKRGSSVDRASMPPPLKQKPRLSDVNEADDRSPTSTSRNFSRPMSSQQNSPTTSSAPAKYTHGMGGWHTTASGAAVPQSPTDSTPAAQRSGASAPLNKVAKKNRTSSAAGSHLAQANRASVTSLDTSRGDSESVMVYDPNTRTFVQRTRSQANSGPDSPLQPRLEEVYDPNTRSFVSRPVTGASTARGTQSYTSPQPQSQLQPRKQRPELTPVETRLEPPPKNPARYSPSLSPSSPRAMGFLQKQPSIVREDREGEEEAEASGPIATRKDTGRLLSLTGPPKSYRAPGKSHQRSSSLDIPRSDMEGGGRGRNTSISPQRSAHFSASPVMAASRHVPPPRDISPAKSALKQSPASSIRTSSPMTNFGAVHGLVKAPPSEISDTSDLASQDGLTPPGGKQRKSVRVSFDEQPHQIEIASATTPLTAADTSGEDDDLMKPRPALPSFGSVRRDRAEKVTEMPPARHNVSSDHAIGGILASRPRSDVGHTPAEPLPPQVTSKESADYVSDASSEADVPVVIPPAESIDTAEAPKPAAADADVPEIQLLPPTPGIEEQSKKDLLPVPVNDGDARAGKRNSMERISVPGGWSLDEESAEEKPVAVAVPDNSQSRIRAEPPQHAATQVPTIDQAPSPADSPDLSTVGEHDSDDSAEFSDAAEDPSEFDIGGFASLDAIVHSPIVTPSRVETSTRDVHDSPESPSNTGADSGDWTSATAYWSQLSKAQREQIESENAKQIIAVKQPKAKKTTVTASPRPTSPGESQRPLQSAMKKSMRAQPGAVPADAGVHMRRSLRESAPPTRAQRPQSAQIETRGSLQKNTMRPMSMGSGVPAGAGGAGRRPQSPVSAQDQTSAFPKVSTTAGRQAQASDGLQVSLRLQKELSKADDSDSESSFKKSRRRTNSMSTMDSQGRYSMKRSMRGAPPVPEQPRPALRERRTSSPTPVGKDRGGFRLRSLSPFGRNKKPSVRESLAASPATTGGGRTTLRSTPPTAGKAKLAANPAAAPLSAPKASRLASRFVDSDDEDENARPKRAFRSRFADSDDEDEPSSPIGIPSGLRPVRGIPRPQGRYDGDSTDLDDDDEDDTGRKASRQRDKQPVPLVPAPDDIEKAMAAARKNLGIGAPTAATVTTQDAENKEGGALQKGSLRQSAPDAPEQKAEVQNVQLGSPERKKRGFMGSILRRNRNSSASVQQVASPRTEFPPSPALATPSSAQPTNVDAVNVTPSSPATPSRGKLVRRSSQQPQPSPQPPAPLLRGDSTFSTATAPPRLTTKLPSDGHWPLPPPLPSINGTTAVSGDTTDPTAAEIDADAKRPNTSDGNPIRLPSTMRKPSSSQRVRIDAGEEGSEPGEREPNATALDGRDSAVYSRRTGKKKKFGLLRKAFGLDD